MDAQAYLGGRILIVDDEPTNVLLLERMLSRAGYSFLASTTDSREALPLFRESRCDLILLDLMMPHLDGFAVMEQLVAEVPRDSYVPVLVLTADVTPAALERALKAGAKDFLTKPFAQTELLLRVKNLLETRFLYLGLRHQVDSLEQFNLAAIEAVQMRDASLSSISHDLGQPLAGLKLTAEALKQELASASAPEVRELAAEVDWIDSAADQLASMISELSDMARLQMGRDLILQRRETDLVSLAQGIVQNLQRTTKRHRIRLEAADGELTGEWDRVRLQRVLSNLLTNAIKYSPAGGDITMGLFGVEGDGSSCARISVTDHGIGIAAGDLPHVFDRFYRGRNLSPDMSGSGIGLAGVKQIVEQHGGSISIQSEEGSGTTVTVLLPTRMQP